MSEYHEYVEERRKIDELVKQGYWIVDVSEDLSGAHVTFANSEGNRETLHVGNADARKYFSVLLMKQQKTTAP